MAILVEKWSKEDILLTYLVTHQLSLLSAACFLNPFLTWWLYDAMLNNDFLVSVFFSAEAWLILYKKRN